MEANRFCEDADWLEDLPYRDGRLCLTATHVAFCDKFVEGVVASESITRAASLFHTALKLYHRHEPDTYDVTNALFVSALEAITLPASDPSVCASCGQLTYRISQRVIDAAVRHLGPGVARFFKDYYSRRSKYLHTGSVRYRQPSTGNLIPQLDQMVFKVVQCRTSRASRLWSLPDTFSGRR